MKMYYVNHRCSDGAVFIARTKVMKKDCICVGTMLAAGTEKPPTGGLKIGDVGFDIKGNKIEVLQINPTV